MDEAGRVRRPGQRIRVVSPFEVILENIPT